MADVRIQRGAPAAVQRRERFDPFQRVQDLMRWDPLDALGHLMEREEVLFHPNFEMKETNESFVLTADLPGVKEEDVQVDLTADRISVSGKREAENRQEGERYYTYERTYGSFNRSFTLPSEVDGNAVQASLDNGVLTLTLPKRPEMQPKRIEIGRGKQQQGQQQKAKA